MEAEMRLNDMYQLRQQYCIWVDSIQYGCLPIFFIFVMLWKCVTTVLLGIVILWMRQFCLECMFSYTWEESRRLEGSDTLQT